MAVSHKAASQSLVRRLGTVIYRLALALVLLALAFVLLYRFVTPISTLMLGRWLTFQSVSRTFVPLSSMSPLLPRAIIASEDQRFCSHGGVDWDALQQVIEEADEDGPSRGASTITMQTARNVFLWQGRSYVRKTLEIPLALVVDIVWSKPRVMEVYLNVAEWGDGIFGAEEAARRHFGKSARDLTAREASLLAAVLPNPTRFDAGRPSAYVSRRASRIAGRLARVETGCLRWKG